MVGAINVSNRKIKFDLHIHSTVSDGTLTPYQIIDLAVEKGLKGISITDHDEFAEDSIKEYADEKNIILISGIEFSTLFTNVHILGYNLNWHNSNLQSFLMEQRDERKEAVIRMCEKSKKLGVPVDFDEIVNSNEGNISIGRPHIAKILVKKGYVKNIYEAFKKYLYTDGPIFSDYKKYTHREIINLILEADGIPVLAHPGMISYEIQDKIVQECIKYNIMGLEVYYKRHSFNQIEEFYNLALTNDLLITGGSDFHGDIKPDIKLGDAGLTEDEFAKVCPHICGHHD